MFHSVTVLCENEDFLLLVRIVFFSEGSFPHFFINSLRLKALLATHDECSHSSLECETPTSYIHNDQCDPCCCMLCSFYMDYIGYVLHDYPRTWISVSMNRMLTGLVIRHAINLPPEQINYDDYRRYYHPFQQKMRGIKIMCSVIYRAYPCFKC